MRDFRQLKVWEKAHHFALAVYAASADFPASELYGLTAQLRRSAVSIASNIAEGCGRESRADFVRFLYLATGSASEAEYQPLLARDLRYLTEDRYLSLSTAVVEVKMMLASLIKKAPA